MHGALSLAAAVLHSARHSHTHTSVPPRPVSSNWQGARMISGAEARARGTIGSARAVVLQCRRPRHTWEIKLVTFP